MFLHRFRHPSNPTSISTSRLVQNSITPNPTPFPLGLRRPGRRELGSHISRLSEKGETYQQQAAGLFKWCVQACIQLQPGAELSRTYLYAVTDKSLRVEPALFSCILLAVPLLATMAFLRGRLVLLLAAAHACSLPVTSSGPQKIIS